MRLMEDIIPKMAKPFLKKLKIILFYRDKKREQSMDIKKQIAEILGYTGSDFMGTTWPEWEIVDSDPENNLYLIHYIPQLYMTKYKMLRGIVVDLKAKIIVARSFDYAPTIVSDALKLEDDGYYHLLDTLGLEYRVKGTAGTFKIGYDGTLMRVFKHNGKVYHSTHRRLNTGRSRWGKSMPFEEMYYYLGGPKDEELFSPESKYSPYCHTFIMVHPDVLNVTKENVGGGFLVYLGSKKLWSVLPDECPYQMDTEGTIDTTLRVPKVLERLPPNYSRERDGPVIIQPQEISLSEANNHLKWGFYPPDPHIKDPRLTPGEFIMIYQHDEQGEITDMYRINSTAYDWRLTMRGNDPNLLHRFYALNIGNLLTLETAEGWENYTKHYPLLRPYTHEWIKRMVKDHPIIAWHEESDGEWITDRDAAFYNIWMGYLLAVPIDKQASVLPMYQDFVHNRGRIIKWLRTLASSQEDLGGTDVPERAKFIITQSRTWAKKRTEEGKIRIGRRLMNIQELTRLSVKNLVNGESGISLYRMMRYLKKCEENEATETNN